LIVNRNFVLLWVGQFVSQFGDRLAMVAFPALIYKATGSALSTGVVLALYTLPYVLFGVFAGVAIDRVNKRTVMVAVDLARAVLVLGVPLAAERSMAAVYVLTFVTASLGVFFEPCKLSILPDLVASTKLVRANSLLATGDNLTDVIGFAAAGFIVYGFSTSTVFGIDAATFLVSAAALAAMSYRYVRPPAAAFRSAGVWKEAREGIHYLFHHRGLAANTVLVVVVTIGVGASYPLTFLYAMEVVGGGTRTFGLFEAAIGAGSLIGALAMAGLGNRVRKGLAMTGGIAVLGAAFAWIGAIDEAAMAMVPFFVLGLADAAAMISIDTYVQQTVPEQLRGRVWTARFTLTQSVYAFSVLAGGAAAGFIDVQTLFVACGIIVAVPALVGIFIPAVRRA
jgi:MFS family permease